MAVYYQGGKMLRGQVAKSPRKTENGAGRKNGGEVTYPI